MRLTEEEVQSALELCPPARGASLSKRARQIRKARKGEYAEMPKRSGSTQVGPWPRAENRLPPPMLPGYVVGKPTQHEARNPLYKLGRCDYTGRRLTRQERLDGVGLTFVLKLPNGLYATPDVWAKRGTVGTPRPTVTKRLANRINRLLKRNK